MRQHMMFILGGLFGFTFAALWFGPLPSGAAVDDATYTAITPCAAFDTRAGVGAFAGPMRGDKVGGDFSGTNLINFTVAGTYSADQGAGTADCGVPVGAEAVLINVVAVNPLTSGNVVIVEGGGVPNGGVVNYNVLSPSLNNSNAVAVPLAADGSVDIYVNCGDDCGDPSVHVRGVVLGFYSDELAARMDAVETLLEGITRAADGPDGTDQITFTAVNLRIVDGTGDTNCSSVHPDTGAAVGFSEVCNGTGNLIVGYNGTLASEAKTGAHNIVVGNGHTYLSYGGLVAGFDNDIVNENSSAIGGTLNRATGRRSAIVGGVRNTSSGARSAIVGGSQNTSSGVQSAIVGGGANEALGQQSTVSGGTRNTATAEASSVSGGTRNTASGISANVAGGENNTATAESSVVSGGLSRSSDGIYDWVAGTLLEGQ